MESNTAHTIQRWLIALYSANCLRHSCGQRHPTRRMEAIVALAGRRVDPPDAEIERFPARNIEKVELAIASQLKKYGARWLISSAAAGTGLLGIRVAIKLGITSRIVVSQGVQDFARMSVDDRGMYWRKEFDNAISAISPDNIISVPTESDMADTFRAINERILNEAISRALVDVLALCVEPSLRMTNRPFPGVIPNIFVVLRNFDSHRLTPPEARRPQSQ